MAVDPYTTTQIAREAPFLEEFRRNLLQAAYDRTKVPAPEGAFSPRTIAGFDPLQVGAVQSFARSLGIDPGTGEQTGATAYDPAFERAQATTALGIPSLLSAQTTFDPSTSNYQQFFNKYQSDVTQEALKEMDRQADLARNKLEDQAQRVGAFGGSRQAVQEAELDKNLSDIKSRRIFQDLAQNFDQAMSKSLATSEAAKNRQLQSAGVFGQIGQMGAGLATQQFGLGQAGLGSLFQYGTAGQTMAQEQANEAFRQAEAARLEPFTRISYMSDILSRTPSVQQTMSQQPMPYTNPLIGGLGVGLGSFGVLSGDDNSAGFGLV